MICMQRKMRISWNDHILKKEVLKLVNMLTLVHEPYIRLFNIHIYFILKYFFLFIYCQRTFFLKIAAVKYYNLKGGNSIYFVVF